MRKRVISWLKMGLPLVLVAGLIGYCWWDDPERFRNTIRQIANPRNRAMLAASFGVILLAVLMSFLRWHLLLRALLIPIHLRDTLRLSFLGFLLNFVALGGVGGDVFKAFFIAHEQPRRRPEAVATILVDRACGIYALVLVASAALLLSDLAKANRIIESIAVATFTLAVLGTVTVFIVLTPRWVQSSLAHRACELPKVGPAFARLLEAVRRYQKSKPQLILIGLASLSVHVLLALGIYLASVGLYEDTPSLAEHFVISPISGVAAAIPLTPGGLGSYEVAMTYLYDLFSPVEGDQRGLVVALCFRLTSIAVAAVGVIFYWLKHREVMQVLQEAEEQTEATG